MKPSVHTAILLSTTLALAGCVSNNDGELKDHPLSQRQQESCLARVKPPQQFGFTVYKLKNGVSYAGRGRLHPNHLTSAEMLKDSIPVINMRGRSPRHTANALIDPSSPVSWMEYSVSQDFSAAFLGINNRVFLYQGTYNTGGVNAFAAVITQMRIDNLFIENIPFYVRMSTGSLGPLTRGIRKPHVDAIVGYDNLRSFQYIQFDLKNNTITFSASTPYTPISDEAEAIKIVKAPGHGLAIDGKIDDQSIPIILDFAGDFSLARAVHAVPPRIGRKLLAPYLVTICNNKGVVYFEKQAEE
jgi:hypothetical protein